MSGQWYLVEMMGAGVALFDYDNDGDLDVFLVQGGPLGPGRKFDPAKRPRPRLFRNDLSVSRDGRREIKFTDVTDKAGLGFTDYGMGVIAGDYDNDGYLDLYITCYGKNRLLHNNGNGTFTDVTDAAGVGGDGGWSTSAAWVDYDRDGYLDLFVCHYLEWTFDKHKICFSPGGNQSYCGPNAFPPARSTLYHNLGNGKFQDVSLSSRIATQAGAALGVVATDLDGDGWPDLFVANDGMANHLWMNQRNGTFAEEALKRGLAFNSDGAAQANMGVAAADFFNRGLPDLFITHLNGERSTFYRNMGHGQFEDATSELGLDAPTRALTGFGTAALDYDNDGWLDIFAANGEVRMIDAQVRAGVKLPLRQRCMLFRNLGVSPPGFQEVNDGGFLQVEEVGRGVAVGDLDNDGDLDIVVTNNNRPARLLLNQTGQNRHWLGLRLVDGPPGRRHDVLGTTARVDRPGRPSLWRRCATDGSYLSSSDPRLLFGLGDSPDFTRVRVYWPDGQVEEWLGLAADKYHQLVRGAGVKVSS